MGKASAHRKERQGILLIKLGKQRRQEVPIPEKSERDSQSGKTHMLHGKVVFIIFNSKMEGK